MRTSHTRVCAYFSSSALVTGVQWALVWWTSAIESESWARKKILSLALPFNSSRYSHSAHTSPHQQCKQHLLQFPWWSPERQEPRIYARSAAGRRARYVLFGRLSGFAGLARQATQAVRHAGMREQSNTSSPQAGLPALGVVALRQHGYTWMEAFLHILISSSVASFLQCTGCSWSWYRCVSCVIALKRFVHS